MEHDQLPKHATQRYFLDEMSEDERSAFEAHYFDCVLCATDVKDAARLMAAGREIAREPVATVHPIRTGRTFMQWMPQAAAASVVSAAIGWYGAINTGIQRAAAIEPVTGQYDLLTEEERGPEAGPKRIPVGTNYTLSYWIPVSDTAASYVASIRNAAGKTVYSEAKRLEQAAEPNLLVVRRELPRGSYQLVIEGVRKDGIRFPIAKSPFEVVQER